MESTLNDSVLRYRNKYYEVRKVRLKIRKNVIIVKAVRLHKSVISEAAKCQMLKNVTLNLKMLAKTVSKKNSVTKTDVSFQV